jgi:serine/threonine protein kinase
LEIFREEKYYDHRIDIWGLGIIILTLLSPFQIEEINPDKINPALEKSQYLTKDAKDLLKKIFVPQKDRISLSEMKTHPWFNHGAL